MHHRVPSDTCLVGSALRGRREALAELVGRHRPTLLALCRRMLGDAGWADDAAQEATVIALVNLDRLRRPDRFGAWLCGIGLQVCRGWLRLRTRDAWSLEALVGGRRLIEPVDLRPSPNACAEEAELANTVRRAVEALPIGQRAAVALFYLDGLSYPEVAATLGIEVSAVKTRLHKARRRLGRSLWTTWKEYSMTTDVETQAAWVDLELTDVVRVQPPDVPGERSILQLTEKDGERILPIWVGPWEGDAAAILLVGAATLRPLTFSFAARLLSATGGRVQEARISRLTNETYFAEVIVIGPSGVQVVDARPSDAIGLALEVSAPIRAERRVLDQAGRTRVELVEQRPAGEWRSARSASDSIRARMQEPRGVHGRSSLF